MLMLPITVGLICAGDACINLVYGRGDFTSESTLMTTVCLWAYSLGIIPTAFVLIIAPAFYSRQDYRTPTLFSLVSVGLNIVLNALMVTVFGLGARVWPF
jgi:putative peptidoglycan lipid II flippase